MLLVACNHWSLRTCDAMRSFPLRTLKLWLAHRSHCFNRDESVYRCWHGNSLLEAAKSQAIIIECSETSSHRIWEMLERHSLREKYSCGLSKGLIFWYACSLHFVRRWFGRFLWNLWETFHLEAGDLLGACCSKTMTQERYGLYSSPHSQAKSSRRKLPREQIFEEI